MTEDKFPRQMLFVVTPDDPRVRRLLEVLRVYGWQTRKDLAAKLNWDERTIRSVAEAVPKDIVRGQKGFNLTSAVSADELTQAANQRISQGKKDLATGTAWLALAHGKIGSSPL